MTGHIVAYKEEYHDQLVELWHRAVCSKHDFLTEEGLRFYYKMVKNGALRAVELWVCLNKDFKPVGFMGLDGSKIEMLFVDHSIMGEERGAN
ncbi:hypothetical protein GCM10008915_67620 [Bifidobacterium pullorum subsp. gallinarum]